MDKKLKIIGTVSLEEIQKLCTNTPLREVVRSEVPFSVVRLPNFIVAQGSAYISTPTTSYEGWTYHADFYFYRQDGRNVDRDRYLGSATPDGRSAILLVPKNMTPYHNIQLGDPPLNSLPSIYQHKVESIILGTGI